MTILFRIKADLLKRIRTDLHRPHAHAYERVGFVSARPATLSSGGLSLMAFAYHPVSDEQYVKRRDVGAFIDASALREALQRTYQQKCATFHVHMHDHKGAPWFGEYDLSESAKFVPDFFNVAPAVPHGALILSHDMVAGLCWTDRNTRRRIDEVVEVGSALRMFRGLWA
jgi:hypothetical protein